MEAAPVGGSPLLRALYTSASSSSSGSNTIQYTALPTSSSSASPESPPVLSSPATAASSAAETAFDNARWTELFQKYPFLKSQLENVYNTCDNNNQCLFDWQARSVFGDFLLGQDSEMFPARQTVPARRKSAIAKILCDDYAEGESLGAKWATKRRASLEYFYDEVARKLGEERRLIARAPAEQRKRAARKNQHPGYSVTRASSSPTAGSTESITPSEADEAEPLSTAEEILRVKNDLIRVQALQKKTDTQIMDKHYNASSLRLFGVALFGVSIACIITSAVSQDLAAIIVTAVLIPFTAIWCVLVSLAVRNSMFVRFAVEPLKRSLIFLFFWLVLVFFGYMCFALVRTVFYNYGTGSARYVTLALVWVNVCLLFCCTLFVISLLTIARAMRYWNSLTTLLPSSSPELKSLGPKNE
jgi:hypothetical protein